MDGRKGRQQRSPFQHFTQITKIALLGIGLISSIFLLTHFNLAQYFPIKTVRIYGANQLDHQEIKDLLTPLVNRGFFTVNMAAIRQQLLQIPWVTDIFVRRIWPDRVEITIIEKQAIARWRKESLLSASGELFTPTQTSSVTDLPQFFGPEGKQMIMLEYFGKLNRLLSPIYAKISYLELTPYDTWKIILDNGITIRMGHKDSLTRIAHFVKVYSKIVGNRTSDVDYIDLRYPNGIAVRWKTPGKIDPPKLTG